MTTRKTKTRVRRKLRTKPHAKTSTALAVRRKRAVAPKVNVLPAERERRSFGDDIMIGELGLVEVTLTAKEEEVLSRQVPVNEIQIKPTGQPYLSHPVYTRWFNEAFGRFGWSLVPVGKPQSAHAGKKATVVAPYVLYIHGRPVKFAWGEHDYYEDNAEQTYGDALESTVASAMRRIAKRMGVGLEMWDRHFLEAFVESKCVKVKTEVKKRGSEAKEIKWVYRLKGAKPFWNEMGSRRRDEYEQQHAGEDLADRTATEVGPMTGRTAAAAGMVRGEDRARHGAEDELITRPQLQRLAMIINGSDRSDVEVAEWLQRAYGLQANAAGRVAHNIRRRDYDAICSAIESKAALPEKLR